MRAVFGLVGLLVTACVGLWIFYMIEAPTLKVGKRTQDQAQQISGRGTDGAPASESLTLEAHEESGRLTSIDVKSLVAGGAMDQYYGLQQGDRIVEIVGEMPIRDVPLNDGELAKALIAQAYQKQEPLVVQRGSEKLTLPKGGQQSAPGQTAAPISPLTGDQPAPSPAEKLLRDAKIPTR